MSTTPPPPPVAPAPQSRPHGTDAFFDSLRRSGVVRTQDRWIGGVAGGVARRLGVDPLLVRGILVVLTIFGGLALVAYGIAWALLPEESDGRIHLQEAIRGRFDAALAGAAAFTLVGLFRPAFWFDPNGWAPGWVIALGWLGLVATLVVVGVVLASRPARPPTAPPPPGWAPPAAPDQTGTPMSTTDTTPSADGPGTPDGTATSVLPTPGTGAPTATYPPGYPAPADAPTAAYPTPYPASSSPGYAGYQGGYASTPYAPPAATAPPVTTAPYAWQPPPARTRAQGPGPVLTGVVLALCLFAGAGVLLAERAGALTASTLLTVAGISLALLGLGVLVAGVRGRRSGVLGGLAVLVGLVAVPGALVVATVPTWGEVVAGSGIVVAGDTRWAPTSVAEAEQGYAYGVGQARLDLTGVPLTAGERVTVPVSAGAGSTTVVVPSGEPVEVRVQLGAGDIRTSLSDDWDRTVGSADSTTATGLSGTDLDLTLRSPVPGAPTLVVTVDAGLGDVTIQES